MVRVNPGGTGKPIDAISARFAPLPPRRFFFSARPSAWKFEFNRVHDDIHNYKRGSWPCATMIYNVPFFNLCQCMPMCQNHVRHILLYHLYRIYTFLHGSSVVFYPSPCHLQSCTPTLLPSQGITAQTALVPFESFQTLSLKMLR